MIYRVEVHMGEVPNLLKRQQVKVYNQPSAHIFVQAEDPDEACGAAITKIRGNILVEKSNKVTRNIVRDLNSLVRVVKIRTISYA